MDRRQKDKTQAAIAALALHIALLLILWLSVLDTDRITGSGSGVLVQVGLVDNASGMFESNSRQPETQQEAQPSSGDEEETLTQEEEETVHIETEEEKAKKQEEQERLKREQERKEKEEAINNQMKNAFGKGVSNDDSRGTSTTGSGAQGNPFGNASSGEITGIGGYGGYNLGGRGLVGSLPYPQYDSSNDAGTIAISITVNPKGQVISAIATVKGSTGTAFSNTTLRASAEAAARKSRFEPSQGTANQTGVIVYHFKQR